MRSFKLSGFAIAMTVSLTACNPKVEIDKWVTKTDGLRSQVIAESTKTPYRKEQYQALKDYFGEINQMILNLTLDAAFLKQFQNAVSKTDLKAMCPKVLITKSDWQVMMTNCTRNRFFLCAEEVRAYPVLVSTLREKLPLDQQKIFDATEECFRAL